MLNEPLTKEQQKRRVNTVPLAAAVLALIGVSACSTLSSIETRLGYEL